MKGLGFLGGTRSDAKAINDLGQIVGRTTIESDGWPDGDGVRAEFYAFIYENDTMTDLNTLPIDGLEDWDILLGAFDINNSGQIVGIGFKDGNSAPNLNAYLLTPLPIADAGGPYLVEVGETVQFDGSGSYDGYGAIVSYEWNLGDDTITCEENPSHAYNEAGVYNVSLTVINDRGVGSIGTGQSMVVVYDPYGGFVTGGGWFWSSPGAHREDLLLEGRAQFGFVSKYKKGATVPTGSTNFRFKAGDIDFHSDEYDWLVVTGDNIARFKGTGTIGGEGSYKFMIWAKDLEPDTFRIKIWNEDEMENEYVIYDNGFDQELEGGNIVVHK